MRRAQAEYRSHPFPGIRDARLEGACYAFLSFLDDAAREALRTKNLHLLVPSEPDACLKSVGTN